MLRFLTPAAFAAAAITSPPGASADPPRLPAPVFEEPSLDRLDTPHARTDARTDDTRDAGRRSPLRYFGHRPPGEFAGFTVYPVRYSPDPLLAPRYQPPGSFDGVPTVPVPDPGFSGSSDATGLPPGVEYGDPIRPRPMSIDPVPDETRFDVGDFEPTAPPPVDARDGYVPRDAYRPESPAYRTPYGSPPAVPLPQSRPHAEYVSPAPAYGYGGPVGAPAYGGPTYAGPSYGVGIDDVYGGGPVGAGYGAVPDAAGGICDLGTCDAVGVPLFTRVEVEDRHNIAPHSVRKVVAVLDPNGPLPPRGPLARLFARRHADPLACAACPPGLVFVEICVPPCACESVRVTRGGAHVKLDYGKYEVELTTRDGYVKVDYDD